MIRTPVKLDRLDAQHAVFAGTAEETTTVSGLFGDVEIDSKYPLVLLQREIWEAHGAPVALTLILEVDDGA